MSTLQDRLRARARAVDSGPNTMGRVWAEDKRAAADLLDECERALRYYANPEIYLPHAHGPAFERRDKSHTACAVLAKFEGAK